LEAGCVGRIVGNVEGKFSKNRDSQLFIVDLTLGEKDLVFLENLPMGNDYSIVSGEHDKEKPGSIFGELDFSANIYYSFEIQSHFLL
jgi:hypothetical protein